MKKTALAVTLLALAGLANAAEPAAVPYTYSTHLDVAKVLRMEEPQDLNCEVVKAKMVYLDSLGQEHAITYEKLSDACNHQG